MRQFENRIVARAREVRCGATVIPLAAASTAQGTNKRLTGLLKVMLSAAGYVGCSSVPAPLSDAAVDAGDASVDSARACAGIPARQALWACHAPSEGATVCVYLTVDVTDVITQVSADPGHPETPEVVACVAAMLVGHCDPPTTLESMVVCVDGV